MSDDLEKFAQLPAEERARLLALVQQSGGVNYGANNKLEHQGDVVGRDKYETHNHGSQYTPDRATQLHEYLRGLAGECNRLSLADADSSAPTRAAVELASIYTQLEIARMVQTEENAPKRGERERQQRVLEALVAHTRLVVLGDPGSGKSTFVNFVGLSLAQSQLGEQPGLAQLGADWSGGALLPVRVVLREFAAWLVERRPQPAGGDVQLLWLWLVQRHGRELSVYLRQEIGAGRALVLLDGLDEVPLNADGQPLKLVIETIRSLSDIAKSSHLLVTCRVLDYQQAQRQLHNWPAEQIVPFSQELRNSFINSWFNVLARLERPLNGEPETLRDGLLTAIRARPELRRLAGNPLLLTMMTLLSAYEGRLPDERVRLYEKCIEFLLHRWRSGRGTLPLREELALPQWSDSDLAALLDRLGYAAHARVVGGDGESGADLPRGVLIETARSFFNPFDAERDFERAQAFSRYLSRHSNGVVQQYGPETFSFPHRTFQEYLTARRLTSDDWPENEGDFVERALVHSLGGPQWREALLLAVSRQVVDLRQARPVADLAQALLERASSGDLVLAGEVLLELGRERLARLRPDRTVLWQQAIEAQLRVMSTRSENGEAHFPVAERVRAGFVLGELGDPRYPVTVDEWQRAIEQALHGDTTSYLCRVEVGTYIIGSADDDPDARDAEKPQRTIAFDQPLWVGRFPITNVQWHVWVQADGEASEFNDDTDLNAPNQPVVGVTWHACVAFCEWLSKQSGFDVRLPTEQEWEAAARGGDARRYQWGNEWRDDRAATQEDQTTRGWQWTTPVGCYPAGQAPCGALDMAGNVWEWTSSVWQSYPQAGKPFTEEYRRVLRGGAYYSGRTSVRCGTRSGGSPGRSSYDGFRVVVAPRRVS